MCSELLRRFKIPSVLFELLLGIVVGPAVLNLASTTPTIHTLSTLGLSFLFFLAGYEIEPKKIAGKPLALGGLSWVISLGLAFGLASLLALTGFVLSTLLVGLCLTTTAIGTLLPMIKDRHLTETPFGTLLLAAGSVGEFGPVVLVTVLLGGKSPSVQLGLLAVFAVLALSVVGLARRSQPPRLVAALARNLHTSAQLPIRVVVLLIVVMVALAVSLRVDLLLGAFAAGLVAKTAMSHDQSRELEPKIEAIAFGFFIPIFFITSGMAFDLHSLLGPAALKVPLYLALLFIVRGLPALLVYRKALPRSSRLALALVQATGLPLIVVISTIGLETGSMRPSTAAALVAAGMASVLVFPMAGFSIFDRARRQATNQASTPPGEANPADS
jgi:Kef-type K+ transport system membrane component KefB